MSGSKHRALIVEDDATAQALAAGLLEAEGLEVAVANSGQEALGLLADLQFDLVFMDCLMPGMDGYQTTQELRRREGVARRTPVIALTARGDARNCIASGMDDHLLKPLDARRIHRSLARWIAAAPVQRVLKDIAIPPRPGIVNDINQALAREGTDAKVVAMIIMRDVACSGRVIHAVNSLAFGLRRKVTELPQAVAFLGQANIVNVIRAVQLRATLRGSGDARTWAVFWSRSEMTAIACARLVKTTDLFEGLTPDEAYGLGLFHNCGIPVMDKKFPEYASVAEVAKETGQRVSEVEQELLGVSHDYVSGSVARDWGLPVSVWLPIRHHHETALAEIDDPITRKAACGLQLANVIVARYWREQSGLGVDPMPEHDGDLLALRKRVAKELGMPESAMEEITKDVSDKLREALEAAKA